MLRGVRFQTRTHTAYLKPKVRNHEKVKTIPPRRIATPTNKKVGR